MASLGMKTAASRSCQLLSAVGKAVLDGASVRRRNGSVSFLVRNMATTACTSKDNPEPQTLVTTMEEAFRFMTDCFKAAGTPHEHAEIISENLLEADCRGHYSHGMNRLEMYINDIHGGLSDPKATCTIEKQTIATALVNGNNGMGAVVGKFCMDLAIEKAKDAGIALVVAHSSNHYGIAGMYALQAINQGFIGMSFTNTSPFMAPTRAKTAALGTNPLSLGAPGRCGDSFVLDMATTAVAVGKIELQRRKGLPIPEGWAMNNEGKPETDAEVAYKAAKLMPLGGMEVNSGYKGYGLGVMVEVFCGMLSGSTYGPNIRRWGAHGELANLGQAFLAINPGCFAPGFEGRMSDLMNHLRNMEPSDPEKPVMVHGDPERKHMEKVKADGGLIYVKNQHDTNAKLAEKLNVKPMVSKPRS
ncbi:hypothetical protein NQ318_001263 [Aromia moschata]|uniref:Malate dehydrogenase n=1 Tax=Aromia moschata TaxID=1265417 RepID=A0AAV8ZFB0_9CUCU|nr:hypothetical protein NQ318_001263 [Aromia moschata]